MSGTSQPPADGRNSSLPCRLADASNVLVLDAPRGESRPAPCAGATGVAPRTDGSLVVIAFTRSDVPTGERPADGRDVLVVDATPSGDGDDVWSAGDDRLTVETASSPANLTAVGVALDELVSGIDPANGRPVCRVPSLTALLQYVDRQRGYRFVNAVTNRLASVDAFTHYHLHAGVHDERTVDTFASLMDAVVTRSDGGLEVIGRR